MPPLHDVDLLSPESSADPYSVLSALRETDPVHWSERHKAWILTSYEEVESALMDQRLSARRVGPVLERARAEGKSDAAEILGIIDSWMVVSDPPEHTRLRKLAAGAFKAQHISAMTEQIRAMVAEFIEDFKASGESDLIKHVTYPLPASIIAMMMGAPPEDRHRFGPWGDELALVAFGAGGEARQDRHERALRGLQSMFAYLQDLLDQVRRTPGDDMISHLIEPTEDGDRLSDAEVLSMCALLLFAGHETTTNSTANGVLALLRHPDQLALLREDPELLGQAVEELLRYDGPIKVLQRHCISDHERSGKRIAAGDRVFIALAGANRDPSRFEDPDRLDITRYPNRHVAFGRGIHACLGAQLARLEMRLNLEGILERLPNLALAEGAELTYRSTIAARALEELPVVFDR